MAMSVRLWISWFAECLAGYSKKRASLLNRVHFEPPSPTLTPVLCGAANRLIRWGRQEQMALNPVQQPLEFKGRMTTLTVVRVLQPQLDLIEGQLRTQLEKAPGFFQ